MLCLPAKISARNRPKHPRLKARSRYESVRELKKVIELRPRCRPRLHGPVQDNAAESVRRVWIGCKTVNSPTRWTGPVIDVKSRSTRQAEARSMSDRHEPASRTRLKRPRRERVPRALRLRFMLNDEIR